MAYFRAVQYYKSKHRANIADTNADTCLLIKAAKVL